jgi:heme-degrading monooxygenase HmoA
MTTALILCRVADYEKWRPRYESALQETIGIKSAHVWRRQDDPNLVAIAEVFESREAANAAFSVPGLREVMAADGVDLSSVRLEFLDDAGSMER